MRRVLIGVLLGVASVACSTPAPHDGAPGLAGGACSPESECRDCGSCFDGCLCGGGTAGRCATACSSGGARDSGTLGGLEPTASPIVGAFGADAFDIPPGQEFFRCQDFASPFEEDVVVLSSESFMTAGSHHLFVFEKPGAVDTELQPCSGLEFAGFVHLAQESEAVFRYPPNVGLFVPRSTGFRIQVHYLNASNDTVHTQVAVTLHATEPTAVPVHASHIFINTLSIGVPPRSAGEAHQTCSVPTDVNVFMAASHMHQHGTHFTARSSDGQLLFETNEWAEPKPWTFDPPRHLKTGSVISVDCNYQNDSDLSLSFGESAATNEMCIFAGGYYPAADGESITCLF